MLDGSGMHLHARAIVGAALFAPFVGCHASADSRTTPPRSAAVMSSGTAASRAAPTPAPIPPQTEDGRAPLTPSLGQLLPRLELLVKDGVDFDCVPLIADVAGLANGDAWVVGSCGLRGRLTASAFDNQSASWATRRFQFAGERHSCPGYVFYYSAVPQGPAAVFAAGDTRCGLDPNTIWFRQPEYFDGRAWRTLSHRGQRVVPSSLSAAATGPVYGLVSDEDLDAPDPIASHCAITRAVAGQSSVFRACRKPPGQVEPGTRQAERFVSLVVTSDGTLWVSGEYVELSGQGERRKPYLLRYQRARWTEHPFEDSGALIRAGDGSAWLFGSSVWHESDGNWQRVSLNVDLKDARDIQVRSERDLYFIGPAGDVFHFDGQKVARIALVEPDERSSPAKLEAAGEVLLVSSQFKVWQLVRAGTAAPPKVVLEQGIGPK